MPDDLEELRRRRLQQLMAQQGAQQQAQEQAQRELEAREIERQIKLLVNKILSPEAKQRLGNLRARSPDFARQVEVLLIQLAQAGRLPKQAGGELKQLGDEEFKQLLEKIRAGKRETQITFK